MLIQTLQTQIVVALKAHDALRLDVLRGLLTALKYAQIEKMSELTEQEELAVIKKEAKKRTDAVEAYTKANAIERAQREEQELLILKEFLPEEMSTDKIEQIVDEVIAGGETDFGKVMRAVMAKTQGSADGSVVSQIVRTKLQK
jgi:uncharacterized protein YqeY